MRTSEEIVPAQQERGIGVASSAVRSELPRRRFRKLGRMIDAT
jgi:hypothetical protein